MVVVGILVDVTGDREQKPDDVVPVYSVAKIFTAAAALIQLNPDARIGTLTRVPSKLAGLRLIDLLSHRSGLSDYGAWPAYQRAVALRRRPWPYEVVLDRSRLRTPNAFRYSNIGYLMVRRALEDQNDASLFSVLERAIFAPLGIEAFPFAAPVDWGHCTFSIGEQLSSYDPGWIYPGTVAARPSQMAAALSCLMAGALGVEVADQMRQTHRVNAPTSHSPEPGYGLGLMTSGHPPTVVGHGGAGPGVTLYIAATVDGSRHAAEMVTAEIDDGPLIAAAIATLRA